MNGEWIKMRGELLTHPRFLALYSALLHGDDPHGLIRYAVAEESLPYGVHPPDEAGPVAAALRSVTEAALRDVTLVTLLRVWCAVNAHSKVSGSDAVMAPMSLDDLDGVAGFGGFGQAMLASGWVRHGERNSLVFPNFCEFNEPRCLRGGPAKSGKERQREYRARKKAEAAAAARDETLRTVTNGDGRREEKRTINPPSPPPGGGGGEGITDPEKAAQVVVAEGRFMPSDRSDLHPAALRVAREYGRLVGSDHRQGHGVAAAVNLMAHGIAESVLLLAAQRYGEDCKRKDTPPGKRQGAGTFYGTGTWRLWLQAMPAEAPGGPAKAPPPLPPPPGPEEKAAALERLRKRKEGQCES